MLLVDETCDSGDTLKLAVHAVKGVAAQADVRTAVSFQTGKWQPDFHAFVTEKAIVLPWDREVIEDGELVTRPDLRAWLAALNQVGSSLGAKASRQIRPAAIRS